VAGLRVKGACVAPSRARHQAPRCLRSITLGALTLQGHAGQNRIAFNGHLP
jgi:hypothetical protein